MGFRLERGINLVYILLYIYQEFCGLLFIYVVLYVVLDIDVVAKHVKN